MRLVNFNAESTMVDSLPNERLRLAHAEPCRRCGGRGSVPAGEDTCTRCDGTGIEP